MSELNTELRQAITANEQSNVNAIRLHLYKHMFAVGALYVEIHSANGLIATSEEIEISSISEANFYHGQIRFFIKAQLLPDTPYELVLKSNGYGFSESAWVGWCSDFDFETYPVSYVPEGSLQRPLDYEIWTKN